MELRLVLFLLCPLGLVGIGQFTPLHQFKTLDYVFSSPEERTESLNNGTFDPTQNIPTSIRVWNKTVFVAVPRMSGSGVPFTLSTIDGALLRPYPNAYTNWLGNAAGFRSVYAMEIDLVDRLWVLDSGRYGASNNSVNGPASLVIIDLQTTRILHAFIFPDPVVSFTNSLLQDITLDQVHSMAYISDRGGDGALIVYDFNTNSARRFVAASMRAQSSSVITIDSVPYPSINWSATGIALSSDGETLYFSPVNREAFFMVACSKLRAHFLTPIEQVKTLTYVINITDDATEVTVKPSQSSRFMGTNQQNIYFGLLSHNAIGRYRAVATGPLVEIVASDNITMQWIDCICFDDKLVYVLSNRMHRFWTSSMNWSDTNFRVLTAPSTNSEDTYLKSQKPPPPTPPPEPQSNSLLEDVIVALAAGVMGVAIGALLTSCFLRSHAWDQRLLQPGNDTGWSVSEPHRQGLSPRDSSSTVRASRDGSHVFIGQSGNINASTARDKNGWLFSE